MTAVPVLLQKWQSNGRSFRSLYLVNSNSFRVSNNTNNKESMVPLFLGADIFSRTEIRIENHPRYHAKFAKKGLATRLEFSSDYRFHGIRLPIASNSLWFYSIQGFFRVAFELYSQQEQLSVLDTFQELWKSRINDGPLNTSYCISVQLDAQVPSITAEMTQNQQKLEVQLSPLLQEEVIIEPSFSQDHDYCSSTAAVKQTDYLYGIIRRIRWLSLRESSMQSLMCQEQETVYALLELIEHCVSRNLWEDVADNLVKILNYFATSAGKQDSLYCNTVVQAVSGWLGCRFYDAKDCISRRVEDFKASHIDHITDLPPAEQLASELFPEPMRLLLLQWMGLSEASALAKRHSEYPILLLILEFANHNLITGVAHVLYSSLISK